MKKTLFIVFLILFVIAGCISEEKRLFSANNFSTPEAAVQHFITGLAKNDLNYSLQACAIDEYAENFEFKKFSDRLRAIIFWSSLAPSEYPFYVELNKAERISLISRQIKFFCYSMLSTEKDYSQTIADPGEERVNEFIRSSDPSKLANLKIIRLIVPAPDIINTERNQRNWTAQAVIYGAETRTERLVLYELNGRFFIGGISLLKYGKNWKIENMTSSLAGTDAFGTIKEVFTEEMESFQDGYGF